jgi:hypothetical protein
VGTLLTQTSSLNHLLSNEHELNFDQRDGHTHQQHHQDGSNGANAVMTDDEDCASARNNGNVAISDDIAD